MHHAHHKPSLTAKLNGITRKQTTKKGSFNRKVILHCKDTKREYEYHATKGWRSRKRVSA